MLRKSSRNVPESISPNMTLAGSSAGGDGTSDFETGASRVANLSENLRRILDNRCLARTVSGRWLSFVRTVSFCHQSGAFAQESSSRIAFTGNAFALKLMRHFEGKHASERVTREQTRTGTMTGSNQIHVLGRQTLQRWHIYRSIGAGAWNAPGG